MSINGADYWGIFEGECDTFGNTCGEGRWVAVSGPKEINIGMVYEGAFNNDLPVGFAIKKWTTPGWCNMGEYKRGKLNGKMTQYPGKDPIQNCLSKNGAIKL